MRTRQFHLGDVLSVTTGRLLSPRHIDGVYDILNFMTGDKVYTHQIPRASNECKPYLVEQFPQLTGAEMDSAIAELDDALKSKTETEIVEGWLTEQVAKYGEMFEVWPIPASAHEAQNPVREIEGMMDDPFTNIVVVRPC